MTKETARNLWPGIYEATREEARNAAVCMKSSMFVLYDPMDSNRPIHWASPVCFNELFRRSAQVIEVVGPYARRGVLE
jgi:hypothetical protein